MERHLGEERLRFERDRLRLLLETTNSMASKLDLRQLVETLSTDLLRVVKCDFCALLLPNADQSAFQLTTLYNPELASHPVRWNDDTEHCIHMRQTFPDGPSRISRELFGNREGS